MKSTELWAVYVRRNPSFESQETITMTKSGLRKFFEQTYQKGHDSGFKNGRAWQQREDSLKKDDSLFGRLLG